METVQKLLETSMLTKNCLQCGREFTAIPSHKHVKHCSKYCAGLSRRSPTVRDEKMHESYDRQYSLAVKKKKLLALQRQNFIDELLLEQLPSTPDLKTQLELIDE